MNPKTRLDRRAVMAALAVLAAGAAHPGWAAPGGKAAASALEALLPATMCTDRSMAAAIGREYLTSHPSGAREAALDPTLLRVIEAVASRRHNLPATRAAFVASQQADFERGDVVGVAGWMLSRSEARLYALVALVDG